jgi:hypothetical protein
MMAATTGPILGAAGIVLFNQVVVHEKSTRSQTPVVVGGFIAAGGLALTERAWPRASVAIAWLVLISTLIVRVDPFTPAPIESFFDWYEGK